ncbi:uncharacterized protein METZ01_LOCUS448822, partial [marine metagenome]
PPAAHGRLPPPPRGATPRHRRIVPRLPDPLRGRPHQCRECCQLPGAPRRVRSGRGRHLRRRPGRPPRARQRPLLRHGRHDGQDLPHRGSDAPYRQDLRGGPHPPLHEGQRHADRHPGHRDDRDRCRGRFHSRRRRPRADPRRPAECRFRAGTGRLPVGRHRPDRLRRQPGPRSPLRRHVRRIEHRVVDRGGRHGATQRRRRTPGCRRHGGSNRRHRGRRREHGQRRQGPRRGERQGRVALHHDRLRRRRTPPRQPTL